MITLAEIIHLTQSHGLYLLFPLAIIEGPIVTVIAAWLARAGYLDVYAVYLVCVLADIVGDLLLYGLGRRGHRLPETWRRRLGLGGDRLARLEEYFAARGPSTLVMGKLTHSAGFAVLLAAGASRMPVGKFLFFNIIATLPKVLILVLIGYYFGAAYGAIDTFLYRGSIVVLALLLAGGGIWYLRRRRQAS